MERIPPIRIFGLILMVGLATVGCGGSTPRIDATTVESFNASLTTMKAILSKEEAAKLDKAFTDYSYAVMPAATLKIMAQGKQPLNSSMTPEATRAVMLSIYQPLHRLSAPEFIEKCESEGREARKKNEDSLKKIREAQAKRPAQAAPQNEGVEVAWSLEGAYECSTSDPNGLGLYAVVNQGRYDVVNLEGKIQRTINLQGFAPPRTPADRFTAFTARSGKNEYALIIFGSNSDEGSIATYRTDGTKLATELIPPVSSLGGPMDLAVADLDGDGIDELVAGFGGKPGLQVFTTQGKLIWTQPELGNCWNVAVSDLDGDGKLEVIGTSSLGKIHMLSSNNGSPLRTIDPGFYAKLIRVISSQSSGMARGDIILSTSTERAPRSPVSVALVALGDHGTKQWSLKLSESFANCVKLSVSRDGLWAAVLLDDGRLRIVDLEHRQVVGQIVNPLIRKQSRVGFIWVDRTRGETPFLVIATGDMLKAFRIKPVESSPEEK